MSGLSGALIGYLGGVGDARGAKSKPRRATRLMPTYSARAPLRPHRPHELDLALEQRPPAGADGRRCRHEERVRMRGRPRSRWIARLAGNHQSGSAACITSAASLVSRCTSSRITRMVTSFRYCVSALFNCWNSGHSTWSTKPLGTRSMTVVSRCR